MIYSNSKRILVLESEKPSAYSLLRTCSKDGFECIAASDKSINVSRFSKYTSKFLKSPSINNEKEYITWLIDVIKDKSYLTIMTFSDLSTKLISYNKSLLDNYTHIYQPNNSIIDIVLNKKITYEFSKKFNIKTPKTYQFNINENFNEIAKRLEFPVVLKPNLKYEKINNKIIFNKVLKNNYVWNYNEFETKFNRLKERTTNFTIQQYIQGVGRGLFTCIHKNQFIGIFAHERIREYPVQGGASSYRISIDYEEMLDLSKEMILSLNWEGPIMVEFKYNKSTKEYYLMEINGRWWGSLPLAINNGVNFPVIYLNSILQNKKNFNINYKTGFSSRLIIPHDFMWLLCNLFHFNFSSILKFLKKSDSEDILDKNDIKAYLFYILSQFSTIKKIRNL